MPFQNRPCQLLVHLDRGFSLVDSGLGSPAKVLWTYSFDKLKASADDGNRLLFLDFGGDEGEIVSFANYLSYFFFSIVWNKFITDSFACNLFLGARYGMLPKTGSVHSAQLSVS